MNLSLKHTRSLNLWFYLTFCAIFVLSFLLYSPYGFIRFTSDHAVQVLMTQELQLPDNLYYWGQERLGSLVPILAHWLHKGISIDALPAITFVHYGFLLGTALLVCRYLKRPLYKTLFLIIWLLPLPAFKEHLLLGHPYAPQFFLLFFGLYLHERKPESTAARVLLFFVGNLLLFLSYWVSELSVCFIGTYYLLIGLRCFIKRKTIVVNRGLLLIHVLTTIVAAVSVGLFVLYAKSHALKFGDYSRLFVGAKHWWTGITQHRKDLCATVTHMSNAPFQALYAVVFILILLLLIFLLCRQKLRSVFSFHTLLFLLTGFGTWLFLYTLHWTARNVYDYKYWTFPYLFVFLSLLMIAERNMIARRIPTMAFFLLVLLQLPITWVYATDKTKNRWEVDFSYSELKTFRQLGDCGLIADYWFAYSLACANPDSIVATPHDRSLVRNSSCVQEVLKKKNIYLVKNMWLNDWPAEIYQFGHRLVKVGGPFRVERASFCRYTVSQ